MFADVINGSPKVCVCIARAGTCQGLFGNHDCLDKRDDERTTRQVVAGNGMDGVKKGGK